MNPTSEKNCARCKAYLFSEDDVVYCPICGAPHHRDCYNAIGHCALESLHGTDEQYDLIQAKEQPTNEADTDKTEEKNETTVCKICGTEYPNTAPRCTNCGAPNFNKTHQFSGFDFFGGIKRDSEVVDGVTAEDVAKFVNVNPHRYIPKFAEGRKTSFNWIAFLLPTPWFFARKMYKNGFIAGILTLIAALFTNVSMENLYAVLQLPTEYTQQELIERMIEYMPQISPIIILMLFLGTVISIAVMVFTGIFGDYWYRNHAIEKIREIKKNSEDIDTDFRKKGGVNLVLAVTAHLCINYLTIIIMSFIL